MNNDVYLDAPMRSWIVKTATKAIPQVASWYTVGDLIQDGFVCYAKCWNSYRDIFDVPHPTKGQQRHFMALVMTAFNNHIATMISNKKQSKEDVVSQLVEEGTSPLIALENFAAPIAEEASILVMLAKLPAELVEVLDKLIQDGFDGGKYLRRRTINPMLRRPRRMLRETTNEYWERVLGQPDIPKKLAAYLTF